VILVSPEEVIAVASLFGILDKFKELIERETRVRTLTDVSFFAIALVKEALGVGEEARHLGRHRHVYFALLDSTTWLHDINLDIRHNSLANPCNTLHRQSYLR